MAVDNCSLVSNLAIIPPEKNWKNTHRRKKKNLTRKNMWERERETKEIERHEGKEGTRKERKGWKC